MKNCIYAFTRNEDGSILESIVSVPYDSSHENSREQAVLEVEKYIQCYDIDKIFILDGIQIYVKAINKII